MCPNGRTAGVVDQTGALSIVDAVTGHRLQRLTLDNEVDAAGISWLPSCRSIFAAVIDAIPGFGPDGGYLERIDLPRAHIVVLAEDQGVALYLSPTASPDGRYVFAVVDERLVRGSTRGHSVAAITPPSDFVAEVSAGD